MSAERLREAAAAERAEWGDDATRRTYPKASAIHLALADWLDAESDVFYMAGGYGKADHVTAAAHAVADAVLGGDSR